MGCGAATMHHTGPNSDGSRTRGPTAAWLHVLRSAGGVGRLRQEKGQGAGRRDQQGGSEGMRGASLRAPIALNRAAAVIAATVRSLAADALPESGGIRRKTDGLHAPQGLGVRRRMSCPLQGRGAWVRDSSGRSSDGTSGPLIHETDRPPANQDGWSLHSQSGGSQSSSIRRSGGTDSAIVLDGNLSPAHQHRGRRGNIRPRSRPLVQMVFAAPVGLSLWQRV